MLAEEEFVSYCQTSPGDTWFHNEESSMQSSVGFTFPLLAVVVAKKVIDGS
jgi:hypothetical protein